MEEARVGVFLSDGGGYLSTILDLNAIKSYVEKLSNVVQVEMRSDFSWGEDLQIIIDAVKSGKINRVVATHNLLSLGDVKIVQAIEKAGLNPYLVTVLNLKDYCAWPHQDKPDEATEKAKAILLAAVERSKLLEPIKRLEFPTLKSVLIIGAGIAGIQAAMSLSELGYEVHLIEREPFIGGLAARAGRFFPTDDCALCIQSPCSDVKTITDTSRKCVYRSGFSEIPNLNILTNSRVLSVQGVPGKYTVGIEKRPRYIDEDKCIRCNLCTEICPVEVPDEYNVNLKTRKAVYINIPYSYPPVYVIDEDACKFHECEKCVDVCPTNAIFLDQKPEKISLNVGSIIVATGFEIYDSAAIKEYHYDDYPDVITNLELARMIDAFGPTEGAIIKPSNKQPAKKIVFIQCVGSRDQRHKKYCSSICCMISLKHAIQIKEAFRNMDITICYIDIRTTGREHEEYYERARALGIKFVKGRPTEVTHDPESNKLTVDVEDALLRRLLQLQADLVVLAPAMVAARGSEELASMLGLELDDDGFFKEYNAKLRPTETKMKGIFICGGATFPKDAPTSSIQAHSAALKASKFLSEGKIVKDQVTAVIDEEYCGDCEFCPVTCPFGAITLEPITEGHFVAKVSDLLCEGCGICVGTCPLHAIELRHYRSDQMRAEMQALLSLNEKSKPLIFVFACKECGGTADDAVAMAMKQYGSNMRVMKVPCTGIVRVEQILEAFKMGAQRVVISGCKSDGCHYETGVQIVEKRVELARQILKEMGIEPGRLLLFKSVFIEGLGILKVAKGAIKWLEKIGPLQLAEDA